MCGIVGYVGKRPALPILLEGLKRLEYRGYDSAGIAVITPRGELALDKAVGKLRALEGSTRARALPGTIGIGHTRWATHGKPSQVNAHPHTDGEGRVAVIHNGIVENYLELKRELAAQGRRFVSETDTEVLPHLIAGFMAQGVGLAEAVRATLGRIRGAHAIVALSPQEPGVIVAARLGHAGAVVIGYGEGEMFVSSDLPALLPHTRRIAVLGNGEVATVTAAGASYCDSQGRAVVKEPQTSSLDPLSAAKGGYKHFMLKEISEQPEVVLDSLRGRVLFDPPTILADQEVPFTAAEARRLRRAVLVGMGTSLHAAMVGRLMLEQIAGLPAEVDNASELRYRDPPLDRQDLVVAVTQSGETVDTLAAMVNAKQKGARQLAICNVPGSQATQVAEGTISIRAGLEIGVASTKTFVGSMLALYLLAIHLGRLRGTVDPPRLQELVRDLAPLPAAMGRLLERQDEYRALAQRFSSSEHFLFLGRGIQHPIAMEGALKLKEVSYIHAEGYAAGEMKHGPIALIDRSLPVVAIAVRDALYDKMLSNIFEVKARDGIVIALGTEGDQELGERADHVIWVPPASPWLAPLLTVVPLQCLAYEIAVRRGCDVDQPRNLAKTVTVE
ncbi:MAG: glutamine--fructose-6-phosphate transaminase (isomerizing) [Chloroflexi bacterium]|nr:glutamine--fructose-6-phosphate transaminase (isomerizing) [Chloroflexota bacterium]